MQLTRPLLVLVLLATSARAEPAPWRISLDTDPTTFAVHGYSAWLMAKPAGVHHARVGIGVFGVEFPSFLVPYLDRADDADGWSLNARAVMAFAGYQLGDRRGLYVGAYSGYLQARHARNDTMGTADRDNLTVLPAIGYQWFPFDAGVLRGAYVQPWAGASIWIPVGGTSRLGSREFKDPYVIPLVAAHVGYEW